MRGCVSSFVSCQLEVVPMWTVRVSKSRLDDRQPLSVGLPALMLVCEPLQ